MQTRKSAISLNVLCKFWLEDDVWNAVVQGLPVAACGETFERAKSNLFEALTTHLEAAAKLGKLEEVVGSLQQKEHEILSVDEIPADAALVKMPVVLTGGEALPVLR